MHTKLKVSGAETNYDYRDQKRSRYDDRGYGRRSRKIKSSRFLTINMEVAAETTRTMNSMMIVVALQNWGRKCI